MIERIVATQFNGQVSNGRTGPCRLTCEDQDSDWIDVHAKFAGGCDRSVTSLAMEILAAQLARDIGLPVPTAYLVEVPHQLLNLMPIEYQQKINSDSLLAFGSKTVTGGYSTWLPDTQLSLNQISLAISVFAFDAFIQNPDRRVDNPNLLFNGDQIRIIDHELAFITTGIIGWQPPWAVGSLGHITSNGTHIFYSALKNATLDTSECISSWKSLSDEKLIAYKATLPSEWVSARAEFDFAIEFIKNIRDNIEECFAEVERIVA